MAKVLLHICCGPCAISPIQSLRDEGFEVEGFFYNPNIHPFSEYKKRYEATVLAIERVGINLIHHRYDFENFLRAVSSLDDFSQRHEACWRMRLEETAKVAHECSAKYFTTTLLSSPYQDIEKIKILGFGIGEKAGIEFLFRNFRKFFAESHKISREWKLYHQDYCGCLFSEKESIDRKTSKEA